MPENTKNTKNRGQFRVGTVVKRFLLLVLETLLILVTGVYGVIFLLSKGPSSSAKELFVHSVNETSAIGFLSRICLSDEEVDSILANANAEEEAVQMDTSLFSDAAAAEDDIWATKDEDGDGIILEEVKGRSYSGYMMIVKDPKRVQVVINKDQFLYKGKTVEEYCKMYDAVACINGGGFEDANGQGNGEAPDSMVVVEGEIYAPWGGTHNGFVGIDADGILHVDCQSTQAIKDAGIQYGCAYGPILVENGDYSPNLRDDGTGINPRTAVGQRADKSILLLVIDGRHVSSLGATYNDLADIMLDYGAINAGNMDGGSSTLMYYNGEYVNNKAAVIGIRPIPSAWIVTK